MRPRVEFSKLRSSKDGLQPLCKACARVERSAWGAANAERISQYNRQYRRENIEAISARERRTRDQKENRRLQRRYGITLQQYREHHRLQRGRCAICRTKRPRLHVDHDHKTGRVRGLLCYRCNVGLGYFQDDPRRLRIASEYVSGTT